MRIYSANQETILTESLTDVNIFKAAPRLFKQLIRNLKMKPLYQNQ